MYKVAALTIVATVFSTAEAKHHKSEPKVDPYLQDPVDLRPFLAGVGGFYNGLVEGAFGRD